MEPGLSGGSLGSNRTERDLFIRLFFRMGLLLGSFPVFVFLAVLAHQDGRRLYGGQTEIMNTQLPATFAILSATRSP